MGVLKVTGITDTQMGVQKVTGITDTGTHGCTESNRDNRHRHTQAYRKQLG